MISLIRIRQPIDHPVVAEDDLAEILALELRDHSAEASRRRNRLNCPNQPIRESNSTER
jgi:hypothetical protein